MTARGIQAAGCDVSPTAIRKGLERFPGCRLKAVDIKNGLSYQDGEFDAVLLLG